MKHRELLLPMRGDIRGVDVERHAVRKLTVVFLPQLFDAGRDQQRPKSFEHLWRETDFGS